MQGVNCQTFSQNLLMQGKSHHHHHHVFREKRMGLEIILQFQFRMIRRMQVSYSLTLCHRSESVPGLPLQSAVQHKAVPMLPGCAGV